VWLVDLEEGTEEKAEKRSREEEQRRGAEKRRREEGQRRRQRSGRGQVKSPLGRQSDCRPNGKPVEMMSRTSLKRKLTAHQFRL